MVNAQCHECGKWFIEKGKPSMDGFGICKKCYSKMTKQSTTEPEKKDFFTEWDEVINPERYLKANYDKLQSELQKCKEENENEKRLTNIIHLDLKEEIADLKKQLEASNKTAEFHKKESEEKDKELESLKQNIQEFIDLDCLVSPKELENLLQKEVKQ
jgi:hypothetical protein